MTGFPAHGCIRKSSTETKKGGGGPMNFKTVTKQAIIVDPGLPTQPKSIPVEVREDPLTGRTSRICHFGLLKWPKPDLEKLVAGTEAACPFCPDQVLAATPLFRPGRRPPSGQPPLHPHGGNRTAAHPPRVFAGVRFLPPGAPPEPPGI